MIYKELSNSTQMPVLGYGTWKVASDQAEQLVGQAISCSYRLIDTATIYKNEAGVGKAVRSAGVPREEFYVVSKLWNTEVGYDAALAAFDRSLTAMGLDYLDLYLLHWPTPDMFARWRALEEIYRSGRAKAIGVSNFNEEQLRGLLAVAEIAPMVNQIERHPYFQQKELSAYCQDHNIGLQGWKPLAHGTIFTDHTLVMLAEKYSKTVAQVVLRWQIQTGYCVFPKTSSLQRMKENIDLFDFYLSDEDIELINGLDKNSRIGRDPIDVYEELDR